MLAPEIESRPWTEQFVIDDAHYRTQLNYLFERSAFYREKLKAAGFASAFESRQPCRNCATSLHRKVRNPRQLLARKPNRHPSLR